MENLSCKNTIKVVLIFCAVLFIQSCSSLNTSKKVTQIKKHKKASRYSNFDRKDFPADSVVISNMISIVQPEMESEDRDAIATSMSKALLKTKIEPQIMVAIIDT